MEFFRIVNVKTSETVLWDTLSIGGLTRFCGSIYSLVSDCGDYGTMFCLWGQFDVRRETIRGGVRFTLPTCPNALQWTVTTGFPPEPDGLVVHCTINRRDHYPEFIESIEEFMDDWKTGLEAMADELECGSCRNNGTERSHGSGGVGLISSLKTAGSGCPQE